MKRLIMLAVLCWFAPAQAEPVTFATPGAHYFESAQASPLAGAGKRLGNHANRVFLDDAHTQVTVDAAHRRIHIVNTHRYPDEMIIADLLFMGHGTTEKGRRVPVGVHLKLEKDGTDTDVKLHSHVTERGDIKGSVIDPYTVVYSDGVRQTTVMTPKQAREAVEDPSTADEISRALLKFKNFVAGIPSDTRKPGYKLADIALGLGRGPVRKYVLRAEIVSLDGRNAPLIAKRDLAAMLSQGAWQLRLTALSSLLPDDAFKRDLKLLGIDGMPLLAPIRANGLEKNKTLIFEMRAGTGSVIFDGTRAPLPGAVDVARAWLEFNFLGLILVDQARIRVGG